VVVRATLAVFGVALAVAGAAEASPPVWFVVFTGGSSRLLVSKGGSWRDATPTPHPFQIDDVQFLDSRHGFAAAGSCVSGTEALYETADVGRTWRRVAALETHSCNAGATTTISFINARLGWSTVIEPTASFARLYRTRDGGRSWKPVRRSLPLVGAVRFRSANHGWLTGVFRWPGPMLETRDGGRSFRVRRVRRPTGLQGVASYESPVFFGRSGVLATRWGRAAGPRERTSTDAFFRTSNGGRTWTLISTLRLNPKTDLQTVTPTVWWLASRDAVYVTRDGGSRWRRHPFHIGERPLNVSLTPLDARTAVLQTYNEPHRIRWFVTHDSGVTFHRFAP
jgi:photosystem II stability/assembly factor-like uncharacterized protein